MTIVRWHSSREVAALQERMNRILVDGPPEEDLSRNAWLPAVDIYRDGPFELVLKAELPDMKEDEIALTVEDNTLTLRGEKKLPSDITEQQFYRMERSYGSFTRSFGLPPTIDAEKVTADYKAGVLTVRLPLREEAKPKQIKVEIAA